MSDDDDNDSDFQEFKGSPDPPEEGINIKDIIMTGGFVIIIVGFVLVKSLKIFLKTIHI